MSDLEELNGPPFTGERSGGDRAAGAESGGNGIRTSLPSGDAPSPKRRGRPPSSSRLFGSNPPLSGGASKAAQSYLGAAGIGLGESEAANRDTGGGIDEGESERGRGEERAGLFRETSRRPSPEPVPLPVGPKRGRPRKADVTEVEEKHVAHGICAIFGGIFTLLTVFDAAHPHKHWLKTTDKVKPISEPTTDWLNSLDEEARRRVQGCLIPAAILGGIAQVVGPDIQIEMEMRRLERLTVRQGNEPAQNGPLARPSSSRGGTARNTPQWRGRGLDHRSAGRSVMLQTSGTVETLNDRLLAKINEIIGEDSTVAMMITMFQGNLQSIPEDELRENLERYMGVLRDVLDG